MLNYNKTGIFCDFCTTEYTDKFLYYSVNFKQVDADKSRPNLVVDNVMDLDICKKCFDEMKEKCLGNFKINSAKIEEQKKKTVKTQPQDRPNVIQKPGINPNAKR